LQFTQKNSEIEETDGINVMFKEHVNTLGHKKNGKQVWN
jgi:hypothetical protein